MIDLAYTLLVILRVLVLILGILVIYFSFKAYKRTKQQYIRNAAIGFTIITIGVFIEGLLYEVLGFNLSLVHIIESLAISIGFIFLLYSLKQ